jgi:hypothetical protein
MNKSRKYIRELLSPANWQNIVIAIEKTAFGHGERIVLTI